MDDRVGAFVVLEAARLLASMKIEAEIHAVATVQEEVGLRGARTSAYSVDPQVAFAVDLHFATDYPTMEASQKKHGDVKIGGGPVVTRGPNVHPKLFDLVVQTARKKKMKHQLQAQGGLTGTDANAMQVNRGGVITGLISVPNRYMHSSCELCSLKDIESTFTLLAETCARIGPDTPFALL
jgi:tetrahedral aminopeptidase